MAGAIGGVLAFLFARIFVEPVIDRAIAYEDAAAEAAAHDHGGHEHGVELITRGVQANVGLGFGVIGFAVAMGALFAVAYCVAYGRVGSISPRLLSVLLAGGMFLSLYVIPFLKYPANPPAVSLDHLLPWQHDRHAYACRREARTRVLSSSVRSLTGALDR